MGKQKFTKRQFMEIIKLNMDMNGQDVPYGRVIPKGFPPRYTRMDVRKYLFENSPIKEYANYVNHNIFALPEDKVDWGRFA